LFIAAAITATWIWNWSLPVFHILPFALACFGAICVSALVHNHVHVNIFRSKILNGIYDYWLTVIYGYPVFAWIATHNRNHHVYNNKPGDFAPPFIRSEKNNLFTFLSYPTASGSIQQKVNFVYLKKLWTTQRSRCIYYCSQFVFLIAFIVGALIIDWRKALLYVVIPQQIALNVVLLFNYIQHVHCDELSKYNHSRNVVGRVMNFFMLNNGFHTAHHLRPLTHWSALPALHAQIGDKIDPSLNEPGFIWMILRMYVLTPFFPTLRGRNMRAERLSREPKFEGVGVSPQPEFYAEGAPTPAPT
jgi:beta-carotene hydroxylase